MPIDYTHHYRKWHDDSDAHAAEMSRHFQRLLGPHLPTATDRAALDVGCGTGFALLALRDLGFADVHGIDRDEGQAAAARSRSLDVTVVDDSIAWLRARRGQFGLVLCLDVIEHVPVDVQLAFVAALLDALAPDGRLICTVPNANAALAARWRYIDWTHTSSFTEHSLDLLLHSAGFRRIRILPGEVTRTVRFPWLPRKASLTFLAWRFFRAMRRLELMAELGAEQARHIPLSLNLMAVASREEASAAPAR
jgi:SAM-dependent methyltransferase